MSTRCPEPNPPLPTLEPAHILTWADPITRIYFAMGNHPATWSEFRSFGPVATMRFDHHPGPPRLHPIRAISYAAISWQPDRRQRPVNPLDVAVLEFFTKRELNRARQAPHLTVWTPTRPLRLLKLSDDTWLAQAHGNAALTSGARGVARRWSKAIYEAYEDIDGLVWSSSVLPGGRPVVLYERARTALPRSPSSNRPLTDASLQPRLARIAHTYGLEFR